MAIGTSLESALLSIEFSDLACLPTSIIFRVELGLVEEHQQKQPRKMGKGHSTKWTDLSTSEISDSNLEKWFSEVIKWPDTKKIFI